MAEKVTLETTYDPVLNRYRAQLVKDGEVIYAAIRAKRESAEHNAVMHANYNDLTVTKR